MVLGRFTSGLWTALDDDSILYLQHTTGWCIISLKNGKLQFQHEAKKSSISKGVIISCSDCKMNCSNQSVMDIQHII